MSTKISGDTGIDVAQLRPADGDPVAMTIAADGKVNVPKGLVGAGYILELPMALANGISLPHDAQFQTPEFVNPDFASGGSASFTLKAGVYVINVAITFSGSAGGAGFINLLSGSNIFASVQAVISPDGYDRNNFSQVVRLTAEQVLKVTIGYAGVNIAGGLVVVARIGEA
jgi:hypothetical protein